MPSGPFGGPRPFAEPDMKVAVNVDSPPTGIEMEEAMKEISRNIRDWEIPVESFHVEEDDTRVVVNIGGGRLSHREIGAIGDIVQSVFDSGLQDVVVIC